MIIISKPDTEFRWVKANDRGEKFFCMTFSQDGVLIAAVTFSGYIMVFGSSDGSVKTSRKYTGNYYA